MLEEEGEDEEEEFEARYFFNHALSTMIDQHPANFVFVDINIP